jgi:hypothetical protein
MRGPRVTPDQARKRAGLFRVSGGRVGEVVEGAPAARCLRPWTFTLAHDGYLPGRTVAGRWAGLTSGVPTHDTRVYELAFILNEGKKQCANFQEIE